LEVVRAFFDLDRAQTLGPSACFSFIAALSLVLSPGLSASTIVTAHVITHTLSTNRIETVTGRLTHKPDGSPVRNDAALRGSIDDEVST
jgi:hypothetical protein